MSSGNQGILLVALQESMELRKNITKCFADIQKQSKKQGGNQTALNTKILSENLLYFEATAQMIEWWLKQVVKENNAVNDSVEYHQSEEPITK